MREQCAVNRLAAGGNHRVGGKDVAQAGDGLLVVYRPNHEQLVDALGDVSIQGIEAFGGDGMYGVVLKCKPDHPSERLMVRFGHDEGADAVEREIASGRTARGALRRPRPVVLLHIIREEREAVIEGRRESHERSRGVVAQEAIVVCVAVGVAYEGVKHVYRVKRAEEL